jgi:hypothetical protein
MKRKSTPELPMGAFDIVRTAGLALPDVEATTKYDGSPVLKVDGAFMAGLATHPSAEPETLVVRAGIEERESLIEDAPETYYVTDYYRSYPVVLVRLSRVRPDALRDLLRGSWRMTTAKTRKRRVNREDVRTLPPRRSEGWGVIEPSQSGRLRDRPATARPCRADS